MPRELSALMIKTTGKTEALRPSLHQFPMTPISADTRMILGEIEETFPDARAAAGGDDGAMLSSTQARELLGSWHEKLLDDKFPFPGSPIRENLADMLALAEDGHAMILIVE